MRCSLQAQGARQPLDGDLEAAPGPDGQRDQEQVERHAESQGRGAGPCRPCKVLAWACRSSRHPGPCHPGLLGLALSALGRRSALWRSARAPRSSSPELLRAASSCGFCGVQHQARADGDAPNPNANRLPLRAAVLVLAASSEADIEPVD